MDPLLRELLEDFAAVLVLGPRASGKTTTAARVAKSIFRLDRAADAAALRADAEDVLSEAKRPVLLDEWQLVPEVLAAVKRLVDRDARPGQFVLTGSARTDATTGWPATGRVVRTTQWGLSERELRGKANVESFFDLAFGGKLGRIKSPVGEPVKVRDYVELALRGGFPDVALHSSPSRRTRWLRSYVEQLLTHDAPLLGEERDPRLLQRYLRAAAANTAGVVEHKTLFDAAGVTRRTGERYDALLELLFLTEQLPAWSSNQLNRLTRTPKRYLVEPALMGPLLGLESRAVMRSADLLGRVLDTFVLAQLRVERETAKVAPSLYHLRQDSGRREIDLLAEAPDGRVLAIEVKAGSAPDLASAHHLIWLRDTLGEELVAGVVFHTGPTAFRLAERIWALPVSVLWESR